MNMSATRSLVLAFILTVLLSAIAQAQTTAQPAAVQSQQLLKGEESGRTRTHTLTALSATPGIESEHAVCIVENGQRHLLFIH
jgi:hypothetical protein